MTYGEHKIKTLCKIDCWGELSEIEKRKINLGFKEEFFKVKLKKDIIIFHVFGEYTLPG